MQARILLFALLVGFFVLTTQAQNTFPASGNVGIGTTSPTRKLHIVDALDRGSGYFKPLVMYNPSLATGQHVQLAFGRANSNYNQGEINFNLVGGAGSQNNTLSFGLYGRPTIMTLQGTGNVGIGTATPAYPLDVVSANVNTGAVIRASNTYTGTEDKAALFGVSVSSPGYGYGVRAQGGWMGVYAESNGYAALDGYASGPSSMEGGSKEGLHAVANGGNNAYGVYGTAQSGASFNAAGYFAGDVYANGVLLTSDRKFKQDIAPIEHSLEQLMKLKPSVYQFKTGEFKTMHLPQGKQIGLVADELKQVFPELVQKAVQPAQYKQGSRELINPEVEYEAVNYTGLIPVLVASVQELKTENDALKVELAELRQAVLDLKSGNHRPVNVSTAYLEQASPNPVQGTTTIRYGVPEGIVSARFTLTNANGQTLKQLALSSRGAGQLTLNTSGLPSCTYTYTLWVDGQPTASKQLMIAR